MAQARTSHRQQPIRELSVIGAGTMGSGIALAALYAGWRVRLYDLSEGILAEAQRYIAEHLERKDLAEAEKMLSLHQRLESLAPGELWIEAVPEDLALKRQLFSQIGKLAGPEAILATNTSTLSVAEIGAAAKYPDRVIGLHFFNPAAVMPLVELVATEQTAPAVLDRALGAMEALGKTVVRVADSPGFIVNRVARPYYSEAMQILAEGSATIDQIDRLMEAIGFPMGPFRLMDFIGHDVNFAATQSVFEQSYFEPRFRPHLIQQRLVQAGKLGRKSGQGFYSYPMKEPSKGADHDSNAQPASIQKERLYVGDGWMAPGLTKWFQELGVELVPDPAQTTMAVIAGATHEQVVSELLELEAKLPVRTPILCQAISADLARVSAAVANPGRVIGADTLFITSGEMVSLSAGSNASRGARDQVETFFHSLGQRVVWLPAVPGMIVPRILAMLVNEAAFTVQEGVADAIDIDRAMKLGVRYPKGPVDWGRELGYHRVLAVLEALWQGHGGARYRPAPQLRRWADSARPDWP